jgi:hypothetical protein
MVRKELWWAVVICNVVMDIAFVVLFWRGK